MNEPFDALVIGAGPGGATTALLLARAGWSVALVESKPFPRRKVCGEYLSATNLPLLDSLGVGESFREQAGPEVKRVALFAGKHQIISDLPQPDSHTQEWGRAYSRECLDTILLEQAQSAGAIVYQPWRVSDIQRLDQHYECELTTTGVNERQTLRAKIVIAAHGSWQRSGLPSQPLAQRSSGKDLLGFKAHFSDDSLAEDLMPLLSFPGGYGGMVHCEGGRVSLSCCVQKRVVQSLSHEESAGEAVLAHIQSHCQGVRETLVGAQRQGDWLAIGPIRPGIRLGRPAGIFLVGNAAAEAHPVIAEGISMALQSAWLLVSALCQWRSEGASESKLDAVQRHYAKQWRQGFARRVRASQLLAHWAMRPWMVWLSLPLIQCFPSLLTWGAKLSGKSTLLPELLS